ncbi:MAG: hypothetical protein WC788_05585 [Candidatus Paceibacterota bacterium]
MTANGTRKIIKAATALYDKGKWHDAVDLLKPLLKTKISIKDRREILMHLGWNFWKMSDKAMALTMWEAALAAGADDITRAGAHAGLGIYFAELGKKRESLHHARLSEELTPESAGMSHIMNLNACAISLAKLSELERAEKLLRRIAKLNEILETSSDPELAARASHQRGKNGYNLATLVYIPMGRLIEAKNELYDEVIPRYTRAQAAGDLAAAYHRLSEINEKMSGSENSESPLEQLELALAWEKVSLNFWKEGPNDPGRIKTAEENVKKLTEKISEFKKRS